MMSMHRCRGDIMKRYCEECGKEVKLIITKKKEVYKVCGESVEVDANILTCAECGEEFFDEELDNKTLIKAYNLYREKHKLLLPEEIKNIREQYGMSQRSFAKLLNWGDKTIYRYENGSLQDKAHNSILLFLREPENMRAYLNDNEVGLNQRQIEKILQHIDELEEEKEQNSRMAWANNLLKESPSIKNGFRKFDFEKFCAMVIYFANKGSGILKVKLLKLLNYSDMIYYKENGVSISGMQYIHLPYGPVPKRYNELLGIMVDENIIEISVQVDNRYESHQIISLCENFEDILSLEECEVLDRIYDKFLPFGSADISTYSHNETGYKNTLPNEVISYEYAKNIMI